MQYIISRIKRWLLLGGDVMVFYLSLYVTFALRGLPAELWRPHFLSFTGILAIWLFVFYLYGLYDPPSIRADVRFLAKFLNALLINVAAAALFFYFFSGRLIDIRPQRVLFIYALIFFVIALLWRRFVAYLFSRSELRTKIVVVGLTPQTQEVVEMTLKNPWLGYSVVAVIRERPDPDIHIPEVEVCDFPNDLLDFLNGRRASAVVSGINFHTQPEMAKRLAQSIWLGIRFFDLPKFYEHITGKVPVTTIEQSWFLENLTEGEKSAYEVIKRIADIILSLVIGIIALPLIPLIVFGIRWSSPGSIFFTQTRIGKHGRPFRAIKFRTMFENSEANGPQWTRTNDPRVTRFGKFLRKTRLDEIPQLWNIFRGEMSFVGPRPEQPEFVKNLLPHIPFYSERLLVKPGLTGWAQINDPLGSASYEDSLEKLQYDLYYIKHRSFLFDLGIILKTLDIVLSGRGR